MAEAGLVLLTASMPIPCGLRPEACAASRIRAPTFAIFSAIVDITFGPAFERSRHSTCLPVIGESHGYYRAACLQRQARRVGFAPLGRPAAEHSRGWQRAPHQPANTGSQADSLADLRHHE